MALVVVCLVGGCASGPPRRIYLLNPPLDPTVSSEVQGDDGRRLQLLPVLLPDYLDSRDLLLREGQNEVAVSATGRWGERLSRGITHALGAALVSRMPMSSVTLDPSVDSSYRRIAVDIDSLDLWSDGRCVLSASWVISSGDAKIPVNKGRAVYLIPARAELHRAGDSELVSAMRSALTRLADSIVVDASMARAGRAGATH